MALELIKITDPNFPKQTTLADNQWLVIGQTNGNAAAISVANMKTFLGYGPGEAEFLGVAVPSTAPAPGTTGWYMAFEPGTYSNFGGLVVSASDGWVILSNTGPGWVKSVIGVPDIDKIYGNALKITNFSHVEESAAGVVLTPKGTNIFVIQNGGEAGIPSRSVSYASFQTEFAGTTGLTFGVTSPSGRVGGVRINSGYALTFDISVNNFAVSPVNTQSQTELVIAYSNASDGRLQFSPETGYIKNNDNIARIDKLDTGLAFFKQESSSNITVEETNSIMYVKAGGPGSQVAVRGALGTRDLTWSDMKAEVLAANPSANFTTSPGGVPDCLALLDTQMLAYDTVAQAFITTSEANLKAYMYVLVHNSDGKIGSKSRDFGIIAEAIAARSGGSGSSSSYMEQMVSVTKCYTDSAPPGGAVDRFSFIHMSDVHYNSLNTDINMLELIDFHGNSIMAGDIDGVICTGDVCNGASGRAKATTTGEINQFMTRLLSINNRVLTTIGNHDDNVNFNGNTSGTSVFPNAILKPEQYDLMIAPLTTKNAAVITEADKCYYYTDFTTHQIRVIVLDAYELPIVDSGDGSIVYSGGMYYSQAQIDWLQTTLASVPAGYAVIMCNHGPIVTGYTVGTYMQGVDFIPSVVNAFKNGTGYSHTYTNATWPELNTAKEFSFTGSGEFICYLGGHVHGLNFITPVNFPDQNVITAACLFTGNSGTGGADDNVRMLRAETDELRNSFNFISIDRFLNKIYCVTYGAFRDSQGRNLDRVKILDY